MAQFDQEFAEIAASELGEIVGNAGTHRAQILAALDLLWTGA